MTETKPQPLWTKNFTIITVGSAISMLGNAVAGFAISLLVLDYTESTLLYAVFLAAYTLPQLLMPLLSGPWLDNFSRRRAIYSLDFLAAAIYTLAFFVLRSGYFNYPLFLAFSFFIGCLDSVYTVAYESFFPTLISPGNFRRAYSISSLIWPLSEIMTPVAAIVYENIGLPPLFAFNALACLTAACFETRIDSRETQVGRNARLDRRKYWQEFKDGLAYVKAERGLAAIIAYFFCCSLVGGSMILFLPYFRETPGLGVFFYTLVMGCMVAGRGAGSILHYKLPLPENRKFDIAFCVYILVCLCEGSLLFWPIPIMCVLAFVEGVLGVTSYNIRLSGTQSYLPNQLRGRFTGVFTMFNSLGLFLGQLIAGALSQIMSVRNAVALLYVFGLAAVFLVMWRNREQVKPIYNRNA